MECAPTNNPFALTAPHAVRSRVAPTAAARYPTPFAAPTRSTAVRIACVPTYLPVLLDARTCHILPNYVLFDARICLVTCYLLKRTFRRSYLSHVTY